MSPPSLDKLTDLPHELLTQIINPLDDESISALAKTCKTLHFFALPLFLSRNGIKIRGPDFVSIRSPFQGELSALCTSLLVGNLRGIQYLPGPLKVDRIFSDIFALQRLLACLPSISSLSFLSPPMPILVGDAAKFDSQKWSTAFSALLDAALQKSCQILTVNGGGNLFALSSDQPDLQERRVPKMWKKTLLAHRKVFSMFSKTKNQPESPHLPSTSRLSSFYIRSSMLLHPHLFRWTQSTLQANAGTLTQLYFNNVVVSSSTWRQLLPALFLSSLYGFELTSSDQLVGGTGVAFQDIEAFLKHNPSIRMLNLSGIIIPNPTPQLQDLILPELYCIRAHPKIIAWLLRYKVASFQRLAAVTVVSEPGEFDYDQFDEALEAIATLSQMDALRLGLEFVTKNGSQQWMEKHISRPSDSAIGCIANKLTNLNIQTSGWMRLDDGDEPMVQLLLQFLALFLSLEKVNFGDQLSSLEGCLKGRKDLFKEAVSLCPRLKSVSVNGKVIDLAYLGI